MSGGGGETNTVSKFEPPDYTVEPWKQYVSNVQSLTSGDMPRYQGQTVAPMTQQHMTGQNMLMNLATNGTAAGNAAQSQLYNTMQGAFDDPRARIAVGDAWDLIASTPDYWDVIIADLTEGFPQLTYAQDHPGEDLPAFRFAFEVVEDAQ